MFATLESKFGWSKVSMVIKLASPFFEGEICTLVGCSKTFLYAAFDFAVPFKFSEDIAWTIFC